MTSLATGAAGPTTAAEGMPRHSPTAPTRVFRRTAATSSMVLADHTLTIVLATSLGISLGLTVLDLLPVDWSWSGILHAIQALAAVAGTHLTLVLLLLVARVPLIERALGHDGLVRAHKTLGPWAVWLIVVHVALVIPASTIGGDWVGAVVVLLTFDIWLMLAALGVAAFVMVGVTSWKRIRGRIKRGTWWSIHLYAYLGIALAFGHQIFSGGPFISGWARVWWVSLYILVALAILTWRVALPAWNCARMDLRVHAVVRESRDTASVWISGQGLDRLGARCGQFINVRFWEKGLFWEAHPYSLSAPVRPDMVRITVKSLGDASAATHRLTPGTRVFIEGPYGAMTPARQRGDHALLVAGGVGIAPMRALAEGLVCEGISVDLVVRAHDEGDVTFAAELEQLDSLPGVTVHMMVGPRSEHPITAATLGPLLKGRRGSDIYACGPQPMLDAVRAAAAELRLNSDAVHIESFEM